MIIRIVNCVAAFTAGIIHEKISEAAKNAICATANTAAAINRICAFSTFAAAVFVVLANSRAYAAS
ncbi:hypothetical protein LCL61_18200 [Amycolatopsis coloradensis]|uniref:Uncharacterized protein n=1 Tax=Amycolatopsis coloradensis TaxID=76021 RepID=A0ACD5BDZ0_9PSEU